MRLLLGLVFVAGLAQAPPPAEQEAWPPAGVLQLKDGVSRPNLLKRVQPILPEAARRRGLQGILVLQFVVEPDGSVGPVRVVTSVDEESGLDASAVAALKQWTFSPGLKDGVPVRVMVSAQVSLIVPGAPPPTRLPSGFETAPDTPGRWSRSEVTVNGVRIQYEYPEGWDLPASSTLAVMMTQPKTMRAAGIYKPAPLPRPISFPMPVTELARFADVMRSQFSSGALPTEVVAVGQSTFGTANWLWLEVNMNDTGHAWAFNTSIGSQMVQVLCSVVTPTMRMTVAERDAAIAAARIDCANIIRRVTLSPSGM